MTLLIMHCSPVSWYLYPFRPKYLPQRHALNTLNQVSYPRKTKGKIIVLYPSILIFPASGSRYVTSCHVRTHDFFPPVTWHVLVAHLLERVSAAQLPR